MKGLKESTKGEWSGDVDKNDGSLSKLFQEYQSRILVAGKIGLGDRCSPQCIEADLHATLHLLDSDLTFVHSGELHKYYSFSFVCFHLFIL